LEKTTEKLGTLDSRQNPLQESKTTNIVPSTAAVPGGNIDAVALVKELNEEYFQRLEKVRAEFQAALRERENKYRMDLLKLRMTILRSFQLPDDIMKELTQDVDAEHFDEAGILF
jgi:hypothetical protein